VACSRVNFTFIFFINRPKELPTMLTWMQDKVTYMMPSWICIQSTELDCAKLNHTVQSQTTMYGAKLSQAQPKERTEHSVPLLALTHECYSLFIIPVKHKMTQRRVLEGQAVSKWDWAKLKWMLINNAKKGYNSNMQGSSGLQKKMANTVAITAGSKHDHLWNADCIWAQKI
jgi:hypothetical protein